MPEHHASQTNGSLSPRRRDNGQRNHELRFSKWKRYCKSVSLQLQTHPAAPKIWCNFFLGKRKAWVRELQPAAAEATELEPTPADCAQPGFLWGLLRTEQVRPSGPTGSEYEGVTHSAWLRRKAPHQFWEAQSLSWCLFPSPCCQSAPTFSGRQGSPATPTLPRRGHQVRQASQRVPTQFWVILLRTAQACLGLR